MPKDEPLAPKMARLPSFPRYGSSEYPLAVALKTGTSQGFRDAWTVAWSNRALVGAWMGRPDAGAMEDVSGARSAARLVQAVLLRLHALGRSDLVAGDFAAPGGQALAEVCAQTGSPGRCSAQVQEFVTSAPPPVEAGPALRIVQPTPNLHVWRNPDVPQGLDRLVLKAAAAPGITQVTWVVDGASFATVAPDDPVAWPMRPGRHRFQLRLPLRSETSAIAPVVVE